MATVHRLRTLLGPDMPLIGVGGISSTADAAAMLAAGADLIQVYTGLIYRGPGLVRELVAADHEARQMESAKERHKAP